MNPGIQSIPYRTKIPRSCSWVSSLSACGEVLVSFFNWCLSTKPVTLRTDLVFAHLFTPKRCVNAYFKKSVHNMSTLRTDTNYKRRLDLQKASIYRSGRRLSSRRNLYTRKAVTAFIFLDNFFSYFENLKNSAFSREALICLIGNKVE
jgi:hypothetical protein